jgi:tetratricopeptide (TPR) repeat protein
LEQATPFLLRGAKQALRKGAPHEAERALETALGHLEEPARTDALLLLAEALHEQGKWESVLNVLSHCHAAISTTQKEMALILSVEPRRRLSVLSGEESLQVLNQLLDLANTGADLTIRVRAMTSAAYMLAYNRDSRVFEIMAGMITDLRGEALTHEDEAQVAIASAIQHYHSHRIDLAIAELLAAADTLKEVKLNNHIAVSVHLALGNIYSAAGNYSASALHSKQALALANVIGNDNSSSRTAASLAKCYSRLGEYREAIHWGGVAIEKDPYYKSDSMSFCLFHTAVAHSMLSEFDEALRVLAQLDLIAETTDNLRSRQNAYLYLADGYTLACKRPEGLLRAALATTGTLSDLQAYNSVGVFTRWLVATATHRHDVARASSIIDKLLLERANYDRIDQTDILCAQAMANKKLGRSCIEVEQQIRAELSELPRAVSEQLERLGFWCESRE